MIQSQSLGQTITNYKNVFQARRRLRAPALSQQNLGLDKLENPHLAPLPLFQYLNDLIAKVGEEAVRQLSSIMLET